jgi:hypothetical protein
MNDGKAAKVGRHAAYAEGLGDPRAEAQGSHGRLPEDRPARQEAPLADFRTLAAGAPIARAVALVLWLDPLSVGTVGLAVVHGRIGRCDRVDDRSKIVPTSGWMRCPQVWQNQHGRFLALSYRLKALSASQRWQKACSPSGANRSQMCCKHVSSSGNSRKNSRTLQVDSEEAARIGFRRSTGGICRSLLARARVGLLPGARSLYLSQI